MQIYLGEIDKEEMNFVFEDLGIEIDEEDADLVLMDYSTKVKEDLVDSIDHQRYKDCLPLWLSKI